MLYLQSKRPKNPTAARTRQPITPPAQRATRSAAGGATGKGVRKGGKQRKAIDTPAAAAVAIPEGGLEDPVPADLIVDRVALTPLNTTDPEEVPMVPEEEEEGGWGDQHSYSDDSDPDQYSCGNSSGTD